ncbi:unnamed protein product [Effrenium voratum]|uniref:CSD domain-containing protein n=1 Tax=Effrenium voratum TaxID=2562239 RepID=A0AA36JIU8_9DINO|nr:unnamed protein product [Effrenium voratum]CAJ1455425.1 unnamed protein product [Effrenium voratum]|mmetsp:Transcript_98370/g.234175  ORF Transcript_98370/g.234175 Transcript_98370/m.234175 type:complete len:242 (-) Transcript_98370:47-772(-)
MAFVARFCRSCRQHPLGAPVRQRLPALSSLLVRGFADRRSGIVKIWNDQKGFGFIAPSQGGDDVFVHRSGIAEGVTLTPGMSVSFSPEWDDKKRKDRASDVQPAEGDSGSAEPSAAPAAITAHHLVGSWKKWSIHSTAMSADDSGTLKQTITVRPDAPKSGEMRREEFQIVGNASWDVRLYPAGGEKEEVVVLKPGTPSKAAVGSKSKGHGRNWAVEGKAGESFDIMFDKTQLTVSCDVVE